MNINEAIKALKNTTNGVSKIDCKRPTDRVFSVIDCELYFDMLIEENQPIDSQFISIENSEGFNKEYDRLIPLGRMTIDEAVDLFREISKNFNIPLSSNDEQLLRAKGKSHEYVYPIVIERPIFRV